MSIQTKSSLSIFDQTGIAFLVILIITTSFSAYEFSKQYKRVNQVLTTPIPKTLKPITAFPTLPVFTYVTFTSPSGSPLTYFDGIFQSEPYDQSSNQNPLAEARRNAEFSPPSLSSTPPVNIFQAQYFPIPKSKFYTVLLWRKSIDTNNAYDIIVYQSNYDQTTTINSQYVLYQKIILQTSPDQLIFTNSEGDPFSWFTPLGSQSVNAQATYKVSNPNTEFVQQPNRGYPEQRLLGGNATNILGGSFLPFTLSWVEPSNLPSINPI